MGRREYGQPCSLASALDQIGERWSLLVVRELLLGPLRFSELARAVGGAPTDVLTRRLRDLEDSGIVRRRELEAPASGTAYELTALGRELERPLLELGRWGLNFQDAASIAEMPPAMLPNALRIVLRPPVAGDSLTLGLHSGDRHYRLRVADGWIEARRANRAEEADVTLTGSPWEVMATVVAGEDGEIAAEVEGDRGALEALRAMVVLPDGLREGALDEVAAATGAAVAT
jgi:DNA-binding HxlR family transcriptional regulator